MPSQLEYYRKTVGTFLHFAINGASTSDVHCIQPVVYFLNQPCFYQPVHPHEDGVDNKVLTAVDCVRRGM